MFRRFRNYPQIGGAKWKNPYITDGIVSVWDAIDGDITSDGWSDKISGERFILLSGVGLSKSPSGGVDTNNSKLSCSFDSLRRISSAKNFSIQFVVDVEAKEYSIGEKYAICCSDSKVISTANKSSFETSVKRWSVSNPVASNYILGCNNRFGGISKLYSSAYKPRVITFLWNGSQSRLYIDTSLIGSANISVTTTFDTLNIGFSPTRNDTAERNVKYYSIRVYERALTDVEIAANYDVDKARFGLP